VKRLNRKKETLYGYLFLLPSLAGFTIFLLIPILFSVYLAFTDWDVISGFNNINFIGLENFTRMIGDEWFNASIKNNFVYTLVVVPVTLILSLLIAIILNNMVYMKNVLRLAYFIPYVSNTVAVSVLWMAMFDPSQGPVNQLLMALGVQSPPKWLVSPDWAMVTIILMSVWTRIGYCLIIYLAALQNLPQELYEAANIDGANWYRKLKSITIPLLTPTTFFLVITQTISTFQVFAPVNLLTRGGPGTSTTVLVYQLYREAFRFYHMGYASAIAMVLFAIIFAVTLVQWRYQDKWVNF
jgi:multiple sugar transport system permease protein